MIAPGTTTERMAQESSISAVDVKLSRTACPCGTNHEMHHHTLAIHMSVWNTPSCF